MPQDTQLHKKAYAGEVDSVEELLDGGENVNVRGSQNRTALQRAAGANMIEVCKLLMKRGADASLQDDMGRSALHWAAIGNAVEVADLLGNVDVSAPTKSGSTPLHLAADAGKTEFVNWCIAKGADVKAVEPASGKTPFQLAKASNHAAIMTAISKAGGGEPGCCIIS